jgi:hypothetical protein
MSFTTTGNDSRTTPPSSVEFLVNRSTGNSTELGGDVRESFVHSAWFPVAVNCIMECTPLYGSQLSQSDSVELLLPETRLNKLTYERFANDSSWRTESCELGYGNESLNPPLLSSQVRTNLHIQYIRHTALHSSTTITVNIRPPSSSTPLLLNCDCQHPG